MKITTADVAKRAGVSTATVSYVLNNSKKVSEITLAKVKQAIEDLNYRPDMIARSLATNETKQLSIIVNDIENPFFGGIVLGFENAAIEKGYFINICTGHKNLDDYLDNFVSRKIDGVYMAAVPNKFNMQKIYNLVDCGIKVVLGENPDADLKRVSSVEYDYVDGMLKAVEYLYSIGHKDIAYISGLGRELKFDKRIEGYLLAVKKYNLPCEDTLLIDGTAPYNTTYQDGYHLTRRLLSSRKTFSAVICTNDLMAIGAINALKENGLQVPKDISVIGFDDIYLGNICEPTLTTVAGPKTFIGQKAFQLLYSNIKNNNTGFHVSKLNLVIRNSCSPR